MRDVGYKYVSSKGFFLLHDAPRTTESHLENVRILLSLELVQQLRAQHHVEVLVEPVGYLQNSLFAIVLVLSAAFGASLVLYVVLNKTQGYT